MVIVSRDEFEEMVDKAIERIPKVYREGIKNVAILIENEPSEEQRRIAGINQFQTLLGLYEGVPLPNRQGTTKLLPDKITVFQVPLQNIAISLADLQDRIGRTIWHEVAHYFGLNHDMINKLENKERSN